MLTGPTPRTVAGCNRPPKSVLLWLMTRCGGRYASTANCASGSLPRGILDSSGTNDSACPAYGSIPRTEIRDGRLYAVAEELPGVAGGSPECLELGEGQTALSVFLDASIMSLGMGDRLDVHGWAFIRGLDLSSDAPQLTASLVEPVTS